MIEINLEKRKEIQLNILDYVHDICEKNGIRYYLAYGTLLGAIRHNGYIPWDDDIDIYVHYEDYYTLCQIINDKNNNYYFCDAVHDKNYPLSFGKIMRKDTRVFEESNSFKTYELGINIDVFALYKTDLKKFNKIKSKIDKYCFFYNMKSLGYVAKDRMIKIIIKQIIHCLFFFVSFNKNANNIKNLLSDCKGEDCFVARDEFGERIYPIESFDSWTMHNFETKKYRIPCDHDGVLKICYGDYMTLPPEDKRKSHHKNDSYIL